MTSSSPNLIARGSTRTSTNTRTWYLLLLLGLAAACSGDERTSAPQADAAPDAPIQRSLEDVDIALGTEETVFDWSAERCADLDVPDVYAHAIRTQAGLVLLSGNAPDNYAMFGADFASLARSCTRIMGSDDTRPPQTYSHYEWITSAYHDGTKIHALVHDEYHDPIAPNCLPGDTSPANPCWWNSVTYAVSTDDGRTFTQPTAPTHLVAAPPIRWNPIAPGGRRPGPHGMMEPSNIVDGRDGYYYSIIRAMHSTDGLDQGICAMRTATLDAPASWRFWNGSDWTGQFVDPYTVPDGTAIPHCTYVGHSNIGSLHGSLTFSTYLQQWLLVGAEAFQPAGGAVQCGFWAATSPDLIAWSLPKLLKTAPFPWDPCQQTGPIALEAYPSLIDHADTTASFERTGATPHLYFMRSFGGLDRDLIRVPMTITPKP